MGSPAIRSAYGKTGPEFYRSRPWPASRWRRRARTVIESVIADHAASDPPTLLAAVDAAYPFGERAHHPYKAWLEERRLLVGDLDDAGPSALEWGAIEVAIDMEQNLADAPAEEHAAFRARILEFLDEYAPARLNRKCPTCGRGKGRPCYEPGGEVFVLGAGVTTPTGPDRLIPHAARVQP